MNYRCIVLAKDAADPRNITGEAMKADGTVNRAALPLVFNPDDLHALEMALSVRDEFGGSVTVVTMGPPQATELLREALYRAADRVVLLCDRAFAVADTLATSYTLSLALAKLEPFDLVFCGRQAIDGDTAQVGPQVAEKIGVPQATYVKDIVSLSGGKVEVRRDTEGGYEVMRLPLPALLTVTSSAPAVRPSSAKRVMRSKRARSVPELTFSIIRENPSLSLEEAEQEARKKGEELKARGLLIENCTPADVEADRSRIGAAGSPTQVMNIDSVVLKCDIVKAIEPSREAVSELVRDLIEKHVLS
jgi:electron transfer flavoprotein beta subunit